MAKNELWFHPIGASAYKEFLKLIRASNMYISCPLYHSPAILFALNLNVIKNDNNIDVFINQLGVRVWEGCVTLINWGFFLRLQSALGLLLASIIGYVMIPSSSHALSLFILLFSFFAFRSWLCKRLKVIEASVTRTFLCYLF